jgi:membrane glycosyltransferase
VIRELIISFDYHSGKTVKKLRELELEKKNTENKEKLDNLKKEIEILQSDYESKLKPVALEIAFNIDSQMEKMSEDEIFQKFQVKNADSSMVGECVYKICQKLERQPSHKAILEMMPERFRPN